MTKKRMILIPICVIVIVWHTSTVLHAQQLPDYESAVQSVCKVVAWNDSSEWSGTGFFIDRNGGFITCRHVLEQADSAIVILRVDKTYPVTGIVADNPNVDLIHAKAQIPPEVIGIALMDTLLPKPGDSVLAIGNPLGLDFTVSPCQVQWNRRLSWYGGLFGATGAMDHGSSGGPVFNSAGRVVGISAFIDDDTTCKCTIMVASASYDSLHQHPFHSLAEWKSKTAPAYLPTMRLFVPPIPLMSVLLFRARALGDSALWKEAVRMYLNAVEYRPSSGEAWELLGLSLYRLHDWESAIEAFNRARKLRIPSFEARHCYAASFRMLGRNEDAIKWYEEAVAFCTTDPDLYYDLGTLYYSERRYPDAARNFERVISLRATLRCDDWFQFARAREMSDDFSGAFAAYDVAQRHCPDSLSYGMGLGRLLTRMGRYQQAIDCYQTILISHPSYGPALYELAETLGLDERNERAISTWKEYLSVDKSNSDAMEKIVRLLEGADNYSEAAEWCRTALRIDSTKQAVFCFLAGYELSRGRRDTAQALLQSYIMRWPEDVDGYLLQAELYDTLGLYTEAARSLGFAVSLKRQDCVLHALYGTALERVYKLRDALQQLQVACDVCPDSSKYLAKQGELLRKTGDIPGAIQLFEKALVHEPFNATWLMELGRIYVVERRLEDAKDILQRLKRIDVNLAHDLRAMIRRR